MTPRKFILLSGKHFEAIRMSDDLMSDDTSRRRLGRGLAALIGEIDKPTVPQQPSVQVDGKVPIEFIEPNPRNPRRAFGDADLTDLAQSIQGARHRPAGGGSSVGGRYRPLRDHCRRTALAGGAAGRAH